MLISDFFFSFLNAARSISVLIAPKGEKKDARWNIEQQLLSGHSTTEHPPPLSLSVFSTGFPSPCFGAICAADPDVARPQKRQLSAARWAAEQGRAEWPGRRDHGATDGGALHCPAHGNQ